MVIVIDIIIYLKFNSIISWSIYLSISEAYKRGRIKQQQLTLIICKYELIYIYIYIYRSIDRYQEFKDVVFEDVVFDNNICHIDVT